MKLTQEMLDHAYNKKEFRFWNKEKTDGKIGTLEECVFHNPIIYHCYHCSSDNWYKNIEIYKPFKKVKSCTDIMKTLIDNGYKPDTDGDFVKKGYATFGSNMWIECGYRPEEIDYYLPEWLEDDV